MVIMRLCALLSAMPPLSTALSLSRTHGDHMILQRDAAAVVWGFDTPGSVVRTDFGAVTLQATTGTDGIWRQSLPPTPAGGPYSILFNSSAGGSASLEDVLFGDVYIAGGQCESLADAVSA
jgi:sialate O-acetylesterase